jgi:hypothetical protein
MLTCLSLWARNCQCGSRLGLSAFRPTRCQWVIGTGTQVKAAKRAMNTFVRKFPEYGLMTPKGGRGKLTLYERGDKLSAMWAKLSSQSGEHVTIADARAALAHAEAWRMSLSR